MSIPDIYSIYCDGGCGCYNIVPICFACCYKMAVESGADKHKMVEVMKNRNIDTSYIEKYMDVGL